MVINLPIFGRTKLQHKSNLESSPRNHQKQRKKKNIMKKESDVLVIDCRSMAGVSPMAASSLAQQPFPTPSPFTFSIASARSNTRPSIHLCSLILRFSALIFSFVCAFSLATSTPKKQGRAPSNFSDYPELMYCFIVNIFTFIYSAFQLFKGVCDIAYRGILIPDMISDYIGFILDQLVGYLLISSSSVAIPAIQRIEHTASLSKATIIAISMSFVTFLAIATCGLLSGYKLCKRIIW